MKLFHVLSNFNYKVCLYSPDKVTCVRSKQKNVLSLRQTIGKPFKPTTYRITILYSSQYMYRSFLLKSRVGGLIN